MRVKGGCFPGSGAERMVCLLMKIFLCCRVSQRLMLLQQMENLLKDKEAEKTWHMQEADAAHKRNTALLNASFHY